MDTEQSSSPVKKPFFKTKWGIVLLVLFFPFTLTYLVIKSNWNPVAKLAVIVLMWALIFVVGMQDSSSSFQEGFEAGKQVSQGSQATPTPTKPEEKKNVNLKEDPENYQNYADTMGELFQNQVDASNTVAQLLQKYPNLTNSEVIKLAAATVVLEGMYEEARKVDAPQELEGIHAQYLASYKLMEDAMPLLRDGLDNQSTSLINQATAKINEAVEIQGKANKELEAFVASVQ